MIEGFEPVHSIWLAPPQAIDLVFHSQQILSHVSTALARNSRNECLLHSDLVLSDLVNPAALCIQG